MEKANHIVVCKSEQVAYYKQLEQTVTDGAPFVFITREEELLAFTSTLSGINPAYCFIGAELKWEPQQKKNFYGFEVAKLLRLSGLRSKIFFTSFFPSDYFSLDLPQFALLKAEDWHELVRPSALARILQQALEPPMSEDLLEDIQESLLNKRALVRELLHDLKNKLILDQDGQVLMASLERIQLQFQQRLIYILPSQKEAIAKLGAEMKAKFDELLVKMKKEALQQVVDAMTDRFLDLAPASKNDERLLKETSSPLTHWKVLVIEDDEEVRNKLVNHLNRNNIQCTAFADGSDGLSYLKQDYPQNRVTVLLCDLRLKKANSEKWQKCQGYDILRQAFKLHHNYLAFFVLTSGRKRLLRLKSEDINVSAYYKKDVMSSQGAVDVFLQKIREAGDNVFFRLKSRPRLQSWKNSTNRFRYPLSSYYRTHIFAHDYQIAEATINRTAKTFVENVINKQASDNSTIEFIGTIKDQSYVSREVLQKFRDRNLTGRRIALALYLKFTNEDEDEVYRYMRPDSPVTKATKDQLFNTSLALSFTKDLPEKIGPDKPYYQRSNLLEEEIAWLKAEKYLDVDRPHIRLLKQDLETMSIFFDIFYSRMSEEKSERSTFKAKINTINRVKKALKDTAKAAKQHQLWQAFKDDLSSDLETIQTPDLQDYIRQLLAKK